MILAGLVGMATKYVECTLAVKFRHVDARGVVHGGPMHYISRGLKSRFRLLGFLFKFLAIFYAFCCIMATFGAANMFQTNQVATILESSFGISRLMTGIGIATCTALVILGGIKRIGNVTATLVPFMGGAYVISCCAVLILNAGAIPQAVAQIIGGALSGTAAVGGFAGVAVREVLVAGIQRAAFSNEAGLGTAAIAHSAAKTKEPVREGVVALLEPFIDTVVICTMTALIINVTGVWQGTLTGVELTAAALDHSLPGLGTYFVPLAVCLFAYSTLISWSYYGERAVDFLFGEGPIFAYKLVFCLFSIVGAVWSLGPVLAFSDVAFGLMVIPNMICMLLLFGVVRRETKEYFERLRKSNSSN